MDCSAPRKLARKLAASQPQISPCGAQAPHAHTVQLSSHIGVGQYQCEATRLSPWVCIDRPVNSLALDGQDTAV